MFSRFLLLIHVRQRRGLQRVPHVNPLFRTWAVCFVRGRGCIAGQPIASLHSALLQASDCKKDTPRHTKHEPQQHDTSYKPISSVWSPARVLSRPKCRLPRRQVSEMGCCGRGGLRFGIFPVMGDWRAPWWARGWGCSRSGAVPCSNVNRLFCTWAVCSVCGRGCPGSE